uniref:Ig-like domain-containing protein n=1 Tax=Astyanax mexicanus TaxID=7994 RepID=A0A3B1IPS2_ASTMX
MNFILNDLFYTLFLHLSSRETLPVLHIYWPQQRPGSTRNPPVHSSGAAVCREIDYYNSKEQKKIPKQSWMMEKMQEDYWEKGTQSRKSKEQWFKYGCEIEESSGVVKFLRGISEFGYDGSDFLSFDIENRLWITSVPQAEPTKRKWDSVAILGQYTKGYLEKECVLLLTKFLEYRKESLQKAEPPVVSMFIDSPPPGPNLQSLTCVATGFYPKSLKMILRKSGAPISEDQIKSTGVRPSGDGTYNLSKTLEVLENEKLNEYDCYVTHSSLKEPIVVHLGTNNMAVK